MLVKIDETWINPDHIIYVQNTGYGCYIKLTAITLRDIRKTPDEVATIINYAIKRHHTALNNSAHTGA